MKHLSYQDIGIKWDHRQSTWQLFRCRIHQNAFHRPKKPSRFHHRTYLGSKFSTIKFSTTIYCSNSLLRPYANTVGLFGWCGCFEIPVIFLLYRSAATDLFIAIMVSRISIDAVHFIRFIPALIEIFIIEGNYFYDNCKIIENLIYATFSARSCYYSINEYGCFRQCCIINGISVFRFVIYGLLSVGWPLQHRFRLYACYSTWPLLGDNETTKIPSSPY